MLLRTATAWQWVMPLLILALLAAAVQQRRKRRCLPPAGPAPLPIIGNVLGFPRTHLGREFAALQEKFGDVVYLEVLGHAIVVLNSLKTARDLLNKRSANSSDRPTSVTVQLWARAHALGFGRRICPSQHFAESTMFILCASILAAFEIRPPVGEDGTPVELKWDATDKSIMAHPKIHRPRSSRIEQLVEMQ